MILFADSGSTKCDWILIEKTGVHVSKTQTHGINPLLLSKNDIHTIIQKSDLMVQKCHLITEIYFYGAGCGEFHSKNKIKSVLQSIFKNVDNIVVEEDIVGAIKATTEKPGVVCILGTGSNCCFFDGTKVIQKTPALGYLLADEGSGNYFGKTLIKDYFLGKMPSGIMAHFQNDYENDLDQLLHKLYASSSPNRFLASYAKFIFKNRGHQYIEGILHHGFSKFINTYLIQYKDELTKYPIHFVGSIAYYSQDIIINLLNSYGYQANRFIKNPIDQLVKKIVEHELINK